MMMEKFTDTYRTFGRLVQFYFSSPLQKQDEEGKSGEGGEGRWGGGGRGREGEREEEGGRGRKRGLPQKISSDLCRQLDVSLKH